MLSGLLSGAKKKAVWLNGSILGWNLFRRRQEVLLERPVSVSVGLESCLPTEEIYLLDKRTSLEIESSTSLRRLLTVVTKLFVLGYSSIGEEMQYFIVMSVPEAFHY